MRRHRTETWKGHQLEPNFLQITNNNKVTCNSIVRVKDRKEGRKREKKKTLSFSCYFPFMVDKPPIYPGHKKCLLAF